MHYYFFCNGSTTFVFILTNKRLLLLLCSVYAYEMNINGKRLQQKLCTNLFFRKYIKIFILFQTYV